jgi:hypothetical protein
MTTLFRKFVCAVFGLEAVVLLSMFPIAILILQRKGYSSPRLNFTQFLIGATAITLLGAIFALAWWTIKTSRPSARGWGITASLINILLPIFALTRVSFRTGTLLWLIPISGIIGVYLFLRRSQPITSVSQRERNRPIPGDGTNIIVNKLPWVIGTVGSIAGYTWCIRWCHANGIPRTYGVSYYVQFTLILLAITLIHESGHALAAWGVGMKIRAFVIGPFQLHLREGKWGFQFELAQTFSANGAIGAVHTNPHQPIWCDLLMIVAGPFANLGTGTLALCAVFLMEPDSPLQAGGLLFLFGIYSFLAWATNLIPFRSGERYSDGAKIYQLLAGGAFAALHGALSVVKSSLVTPLRPRDYNLELMERATEGGAADGKQLMLLFLFRYQHFLDCGHIPEAGLALAGAEAIYRQCASEIPAELHASFVFGNAYVKRDPVGARAWWQRMEEKKPTRLNADYWLAHSAFHWIEGDLYTANDSWHRGAMLAKQLPEVGAYEFDRYRYVLLREALDESASRLRNRMESLQRGTGTLTFLRA